ncbi:metal ABC transporter permease [Candidatus Berkelbacteria bacterium]|nr:metal ABC transporter permease [Candidatus Berkelbacteria bacterium]
MILPLTTLITEPFFVRAILAGVILGVIGGVIGSFIQMRGMSFYTDTISHSAFTGVALGVLFGLDVGLSSVLFAIGVGILVLEIRKRSRLSFDTILGVLFATVAALGIFLLTFLENVRIDLFSLLFGDILALSTLDVWVIGIAGLFSLISLAKLSDQLVLEIIHPDLAQVEGVPVRRNDTIFGIVVAIMIALGIKLIGIILLSGLFLIPSATSYLIAKSLRELITGSVFVGIVAALIGPVLSAIFDTPTGPTIVLAASALFILALSLRPVLNPEHN